MACPECGDENPLSARYCAGCGGPLAETVHPERSDSSTDSSEGERKQASILVGEVVNTPELAERFGPEAVLAATSAFFDGVREEVGRYGGTVNELPGRGRPRAGGWRRRRAGFG